jgi:hypothetical protein
MLTAAIVLVIALAVLSVSFTRAAERTDQRGHLMLAAVVVPLVITFVSLQLAYSISNSSSASSASWVVPTILVIAVLSGTALFSARGFRSWYSRVGATLAYVVLASTACVLMGIFTACSNGDCI